MTRYIRTLFAQLEIADARRDRVAMWNLRARLREALR